ncbi:jhy protein homolog [Ammospiza caudacuta]|uniref:jhy protein homolog n=1 Tax=Ammospiza caudacuta TaxID=2857398 RepID=UPI0027398C6F|nr:jhy protein homolog [Ammospiza caudacuta]
MRSPNQTQFLSVIEIFSAGLPRSSARPGMNPPAMRSLPVPSPLTHPAGSIQVPPKTLVPPVFQAASWARGSSSASSAEDCQDSGSEERQRQLRQSWNQGLAGHRGGDTPRGDSAHGDSPEEMSSAEEGAEHDARKAKICGRNQQPVDKHSSLRYNPHWKNAKKGDFFEAEKAPQIFGGSSEDFSVDSFYLHSDGSSEDNHQSQDSLPEIDPELFTFYGANVASTKADGPQAKREEPADGFHSKNNPGHAFPPQNQQDPPQRAKKNFVKKNKQTLGQSERINSYLELHHKKQQVLQGQVPDPPPADEEPFQNVPASQTGKMKPEDKWYPKGQQLKAPPGALRGLRAEPRRSRPGRAFPRSAGPDPPGAAGAAGTPRPQPPSAAPAVPPAPGHDPSPALAPNSPPCPPEKPQSGLNDVPNSHPTPGCFLPIFQNFYPPQVLNASQEDEKHRQGSAAGIPQQFPADPIPERDFSWNSGSTDQAHLELENIPADFNAIFEEKVKDQAALPDFQSHIHEDCSSPTSACRISHFIEKKEKPRFSDFGDAFAGTWLWGLFPPALPQGDSGKAEGNPRKMRRSSSEGSLLQREKQNQPKISKKLGSSKFYFNQSMKLGGLGPDYETIKEKKEKMKLQKEYSRQIKEYNMKNITVVQRLPAKPQVPSVSRQKALEYAKKIPRPKISLAKQSEPEGKEVLAQAPAGPRFPKIPSLESLWSRHEKEKEAVAAFEALHIL